MKYEIVVSPWAEDSDRAVILDGLEAYNYAETGPTDFGNIAVLIRQRGKSETVGGLWGKVDYDWLFVELLFIPAELRGRDLGTELMTRAEQIARARNCVGVWLDTHGFQAPGFYERLGYKAFGELPENPRGSRRIFYQKLLQ